MYVAVQCVTPQTQEVAAGSQKANRCFQCLVLLIAIEAENCQVRQWQLTGGESFV